jgi:hypothetical protein
LDPAAAIEPERPGLYRADPEQSSGCPRIPGQARPDLVLIRRLYHVQGLLAVTHRAAEDDETVVDQPVHESRVIVPAVLIPDRAGEIPARAVNQPHREIGHARTVLTSSRRIPTAGSGARRWPSLATDQTRAQLLTGAG